MEIEVFLGHFAEQFEEIEENKLKAETRYRDLGEWSSLVALSVLAMIDEEYDVQIKGEEMRNTKTIGELYKLVESKLSK